MPSVYQLALFPLEKRCVRCGLTKSITEFGTYHRRGKDRSYVRAKCRACMRTYDRERWPTTAQAKRADENRQRIAQAPEKRCARCGVIKPRAAFGPRRDRRGGMRARCRDCERAAGRARHAQTPMAKEIAAKKALWAQGQQRCLRCGDVKPFAEFYHDRGRSHGHQSKCKQCVNAVNAAWTAEHNDDYAAYQKRYRRLHRERINGQQRLWAKAHPLVSLAKQSKRVTIQRRTAGSYTADDVRALLHAQAGCCAYCGCRVRFNVPRRRPDKATVDHIVPITRGGSNWPENLCIACARCNSSKRERLLSEWTDRWYLAMPPDAGR